ncbi:uncharacterized protein H6S33_008325 [Morchella sextelata]|uniref:uncharacterized protein n=1 Tax=Morchella sextelata TaxID=1174677 RepID=UPI001D05B5AA|nr:uncharacterized protein H6S33_008325 [Morchella sextelata]KAH0602675.1 hypothetical protein H6S33_008325 [Morchella sextelata]
MNRSNNPQCSHRYHYHLTWRPGTEKNNKKKLPYTASPVEFPAISRTTANPRSGAVILNQKRPINPVRSYEQLLEPLVSFCITRIPALNLKGKPRDMKTLDREDEMVARAEFKGAEPNEGNQERNQSIPSHHVTGCETKIWGNTKGA